ncbi:MAG: hypothetical protein ACOCTQ_03135 [Planctomycetota bacterium]
MSMIIYCVTAISSLPAEEGETLKIEQGKAAIVIPNPPINALDGYRYQKDLTQRHAAERLQMLVEKATGFQPPVVRADADDEKQIRIFVGYGPHLADRIDPPESPEGIKISKDKSDVFLIGEIAPAGTNNWPVDVDRGVMHAVETFAERVMGYRFLFSTPDDPDMFELGTVIPDLDVVEVQPHLHITDAPAFAHRDPHGMPGGHIGLRTGGSRAFFCNHSYPLHQWRQHYKEAHPEVFRMKKDGSRDFNHLDYAEPKVLERTEGYEMGDKLQHVEIYSPSDIDAFLKDRSGDPVVLGYGHRNYRKPAERLADWLKDEYDVDVELTMAGPRATTNWTYMSGFGWTREGAEPVEPDIVIGNVQNNALMWRYASVKNDVYWLPLEPNEDFPEPGRALVMLSLPVKTRSNGKPGGKPAGRQLVIGATNASDARQGIEELINTLGGAAN